MRPASITSATSLQDAYFVCGTAKALMAKLATQPDAILVSDETVKDFQLALGNVINLRLQDSRTKKLQMHRGDGQRLGLDLPRRRRVTRPGIGWRHGRSLRRFVATICP